MLYQAYQAHSDIMVPVRAWAGAAMHAFAPLNGYSGPVLKNLTAAYELIARAGLTHVRPPYGIETVMVGNEELPVREEAAYATPFGTLLHFAKDVAAPQPRVLLVAPLSGHFATLLRNTVKTMLPEHDVYITDWHNARDAPLSAGRFGFDDYVEHLIKFLEIIGPGAHVVAVCQPCVAALAAAAVMAQQGNEAQPRSMTLMAGPIDCRVNPTKVNELATSKPIVVVRAEPDRERAAALSGRVPPRLSGLRAARGVHEHEHRPPREGASASFTTIWSRAISPRRRRRRRSTMNISRCSISPPSSISRPCASCFRSMRLPRARSTFRGEPVEPRAIRRTALFTVEGEKDDICAVGQTLAAQELCSSIRPYRKRHHMQPGAGHYGVFSGKKWEAQIYPLLKNVILSSD